MLRVAWRAECAVDEGTHRGDCGVRREVVLGDVELCGAVEQSHVGVGSSGREDGWDEPQTFIIHIILLSWL